MNCSCRTRILLWRRVILTSNGIKGGVHGSLLSVQELSGVPRVNPAAPQCFQKSCLDFPDAETPPDHLVPAYRCTPACASSILLGGFKIVEAFDIFIGVLQARDKGFPVALSIVRLHVSDDSGRKYISFHAVSRTRGWTC